MTKAANLANIPLKTNQQHSTTISDCRANLIAVTETWLTVNDDAVRAEIWPPGYKLVDLPRSSRGGGGTALIYRDAFNVSQIDAGEKVSFKFSEWKVVIPSSHDLRIIIVYRPPYSDNHKVPPVLFSTNSPNI